MMSLAKNYEMCEPTYPDGWPVVLPMINGPLALAIYGPLLTGSQSFFEPCEGNKNERADDRS